VARGLRDAATLSRALPRTWRPLTMPRKAFRYCIEPGCPQIVRDAPRCEAHTKTTAQRGYGAKWRVLRAGFLRRSPKCEQCGARATEVDHMTPLAKGGTNHHRNLRALCKACHSRKTVAEDGGFGQ
jgi:5-methylcytosine-specific restriction protein A